MEHKKPFNRALKRTLERKAKESPYTFAQIAEVYRRGQGAYLSKGNRNVSMAQWAMARVNKFLRGGGIDTDIAKNRKRQKKELDYLERYGKGLPKEVSQTIGIEGGQILTLPSGVTVSLAPSGKYKILEEKPKEEPKDETPKEIKRKFPHITVSKNYSETEIAFLFKYISPVGYYEWHKLASNLIFNSKNWNAQQIFQVFSAPAYYLTDELSTAFLDTPIHELKIEKNPQIINNHFFVLQSNEINLVNYMFIDTETGLNDVEVVCHLSTKSRFIRSEGITLGKESKQRFMFGFNWNNLNAIRTNNISKAVNSPLWINKSKDYTFDELPRTYQQQFLIVVNLILFMNQEPDITVEYLPPSQTIPIQREMNRSGKFKPRAVTWIGKEFSERVIKLRPKTDMLEVKEAGIPRRPHWRRGHWHTVCQGFKRRQRKLKWFEPCYVKGKNL
tara:strand:- start:18 stop:1352 length:1335 start_codon:yes stop_codon:yes gene_type:complete